MVKDSLTLHRIASCLRARRFDGGALRLDNTRLFFKLDEEGNPCDYGVYEQARKFVRRSLRACVMASSVQGGQRFCNTLAYLLSSFSPTSLSAERGQPASGGVHAASKHDHSAHGSRCLARPVRCGGLYTTLQWLGWRV